MTKRNINPDRLSALRNQRRFSQKELAEKIGVDIGTLSRWERGDKSPRGNNLASLCEELGTTAEELCATGPLPEAPTSKAARRDQITMKLDTACRNALSLVAHRYGVTRQQIVEIAPLLFAIMAEKSLAKRSKWLDTRHDAPSHLHNSLRGPFDEDDETVLDAERRSIEKRDLFAMGVGNWDEHHHKNNPFADFLSARLSKSGLGTEVSWEGDDAPRYRLGLEELTDLLGNDAEAHDRILSGKVALAEMPREIRRAAPEDKANWVKEKANLNHEEALADLDELASLDVKQFLADMGAHKGALNTAKDDDDDF